MDTLNNRLGTAAEQLHFNGAVRVDDAGTVIELAFGLADRAHGLVNTPQTQFGLASGSKAFTALAVLSLVAERTMGLDDPVRRWLGGDLTRVDDHVTVRHLLSHTSGVGEYLDDDADPNEYLMPGSMHTYTSPEDLMPLLDVPMLGTPGEGFAYSNAGFVLLGLVAQRASGVRYQDLVRQRVIEPAGLTHTDFLRSDELPGTAAIGYLYPDGARTNVFHLPIEGSADGGAYSTVADLRDFWTALAAGRIVSPALVEQMTTLGPDHDADDPYGLGIWLPKPGVWQLVGADAGVSMVSEHHPGRDLTMTVLANDSEGAWPLWKALRDATGTSHPD
ncbi:MAG: serine hydrolase domain-containing protein [Ornithinimicrobium sp.]